MELREFRAGDGTKLVYRIWRKTREDSGANIALLHGLGIHGGRYARLATRLADEGRTVYALDLRGHGLSEGPRGRLGSKEILLSDIDLFLQLVTQDQENREVSLIGESMGGLLALAATSRNRNPVNTLVLLAPALRPHRRQILSREAFFDVAATSLRNRAVSLSLTGWRLESTAKLPFYVEETRRDPLTLRIINWRYVCTLAKIGWNWWRYAESIACPVLTLIGTSDFVVNVESVVSLHRKLRNSSCELMLLNGAYHALLWDTHEEQVVSSISGWLGNGECSRRQGA